MAERSLLMKADGDARAGLCGKRWSIFRLKSAYLSTFYRFQQLRSIAAEAFFHFSGGPNEPSKNGGRSAIENGLIAVGEECRHPFVI